MQRGQYLRPISGHCPVLKHTQTCPGFTLQRAALSATSKHRTQAFGIFPAHGITGELLLLPCPRLTFRFLGHRLCCLFSHLRPSLSPQIDHSQRPWHGTTFSETPFWLDPPAWGHHSFSRGPLPAEPREPVNTPAPREGWQGASLLCSEFRTHLPVFSQ